MTLDQAPPTIEEAGLLIGFPPGDPLTMPAGFGAIVLLLASMVLLAAFVARSKMTLGLGVHG